MQQILLVVTAIALGLTFGALTGGFAFSSLVCLVAGVFLVTPSLFKFQLSDLKLVRNHLPSIASNLWINYLLLVIAALIIGFLSRDIGIAGALLLLALLPGGGMVMMWIRTSGANVKLGFIIFMLNLVLLLPITLIFGQFFPIASGWFPAPDLGTLDVQSTGREIMPFAPFVILIVIPFVISRLIRRFSPKLIELTNRHQSLISKATMFGIVFYLFSLSTSQMLFSVSLSDLLVAVVSTTAFYGVAFLAAEYLTDKSAEGKAVYWHVATRYITLALILAVFSLETFGATFILPVMIAYFIQIGSAGVLSRRQLSGPSGAPAQA